MVPVKAMQYFTQAARKQYGRTTKKNPHSPSVQFGMVGPENHEVVTMTTGNLSVQVKPTTGEYASWEKLGQHETVEGIRIDNPQKVVEWLKPAVRHKGSAPVTFQIEADGSWSLLNQAGVDYTGMKSGEEHSTVEAGFNPRYLSDALAKYPADTPVSINFVRSEHGDTEPYLLKPVTITEPGKKFTDDGERTLLMPVRLH